MLHTLRTSSDHPDFQRLVALLDRDLAFRDGADHAFYAQFNTLDKIRYAVLAFWENQPVGCGAIRAYDADALEVKRMFVLPEYRGRGIAAAVLSDLEAWARELGHSRCVLETGKKQPEAIALYQKSGYRTIPNYGQYVGVDNSVCMEKSVG
ncbi:MAG: GNAT family N-acetyltransferase [Saprospiraceae bacterium]